MHDLIAPGPNWSEPVLATTEQKGVIEGRRTKLVRAPSGQPPNALPVEVERQGLQVLFCSFPFGPER
jgi:hypothetical protein